MCGKGEGGGGAKIQLVTVFIAYMLECWGVEVEVGFFAYSLLLSSVRSEKFFFFLRTFLIFYCVW